MNRIAIGIGSSSAADAALGWATEIAGKAGASLVAVRAIPERLNELPLDRRREIKDAVVGELESWVAPAVEAGVEVEPVVYEGDPRAALMVYGQDPGVDLVVVGRTSESAGPGFLHLGSVTEHLAHHGTFPWCRVTLPSSESLSDSTDPTSPSWPPGGALHSPLRSARRWSACPSSNRSSS